MKIISELKNHEEVIRNSIRPYIKILAKKTDKPLDPWISKAGDYPYILKDEKYPSDTLSNGKTYWQYPLIQINCEDLPELEYFPRKGIIVFYVSEDLQRHTIRYYENVEKSLDKLNLDKPFSLKDIWFNSPFKKASKIFFEKKEASVSWGDWQFEKFFSEKVLDSFYDSPKYDKIFDVINELSSSQDKNKLGGYANPNQDDVRNKKGNEKYSILLLQIENDNFILDFFISPENLKKLDFTDVLFYATCD